MSEFWSAKDALGEFTGSFILALAVLLITFASKAKSLKLDTVLKQRAFTAIGVFSAIMVGAMTAKTLGAHGQINPGVTLIVATIEKEFAQVPMLIGFQLLGAIFAYLIFISTVSVAGRKEELKDTFKWSSQSSVKTSGMETLGNVFWFLPIAAMYIGLTRGNNLDFYQLLIIASFGKLILIMVLGEFGHGNYNGMVWFANFLTIMTAQKTIGKKALIQEITGVTTSLLIGLASGGIGLLALSLQTT